MVGELVLMKADELVDWLVHLKVVLSVYLLVDWWVCNLVVDLALKLVDKRDGQSADPKV